MGIKEITKTKSKVHRPFARRAAPRGGPRYERRAFIFLIKRERRDIYDIYHFKIFPADIIFLTHLI